MTDHDVAKTPTNHGFVALVRHRPASVQLSYVLDAADSLRCVQHRHVPDRNMVYVGRIQLVLEISENLSASTSHCECGTDVDVDVAQARKARLVRIVDSHHCLLIGVFSLIIGHVGDAR